jgi:hypothetical protein
VNHGRLLQAAAQKDWSTDTRDGLCAHGGGIRSDTVQDWFAFSTKPMTTNSFCSLSGRLVWTRIDERLLDRPRALGFHSDNFPERSPWSNPEIKWRFRWFGFGNGSMDDFSIGDVRLWTIPYWSLVIPLTILSAWMILSKPKTAKLQQPTTQSAN